MTFNIDSNGISTCKCCLCKEYEHIKGTTIKTTKICKIILMSLMDLKPDLEFYSLKADIHPFILRHWHLLINFSQFKNKNWKKSILDAFNHSAGIESGKDFLQKTGYYRFKKTYLIDERKQLTKQEKMNTCFVLPNNEPKEEKKLVIPENFQFESVEWEYQLTLKQEVDICVDAVKQELAQLRLLLQSNRGIVFKNLVTTETITSEYLADLITDHLNNFLLRV